jgi:hypothetical protein
MPFPNAALVHNIALVFLVLDVCYMATFFGITVHAMFDGRQIDETDGMLAIASPHAAIIPTLVTILSSSRAAALDGSQTLSVDTGWFLVPVLAVPFDILQVTQSFITKPFTLQSTIVFCYGLCLSILIGMFTSLLYVEHNRRANKTPGHELRDGLKIVTGAEAPSLARPRARRNAGLDL